MTPEVKKEAYGMLVGLGYKVYKEDGCFTRSDEKHLRSIIGGIIDLQDALEDSVIESVAENIDTNVGKFKERVRGSNLQVNVVNSLFRKYSIDFLEEFKEEINWNNHDLYRDFINQKPDYPIAPYSTFKMSRFLFQFKDHINWESLLRYYNMPENEIVYFQDYVNWDMISKNTVLSEGFIKEFKDFVNWKDICKAQEMSDEFILHMNKYIDFNVIVKTQKLSMNILNAFLSRMNIDDVCRFQCLDDYFLIGHADEINWRVLYGSRSMNLSSFVREQCWDKIREYVEDPNKTPPRQFLMNETVRRSVFEEK